MFVIIKQAMNNWKTTSLGILMGGGSIIHLAYSVYHQTSNENTWQGCLIGVVGGIGLIFAGDAGAKPAATPPPTPDAK